MTKSCLYFDKNRNVHPNSPLQRSNLNLNLLKGLMMQINMRKYLGSMVCMVNIANKLFYNAVGI